MISHILLKHCVIIKNQVLESLDRNYKNIKKLHIKCKKKGNYLDHNKKSLREMQILKITMGNRIVILTIKILLRQHIKILVLRWLNHTRSLKRKLENSLVNSKNAVKYSSTHYVNSV